MSLPTPSPIALADRSKGLPLSFAQQRLWFLAQMEGVSEVYHIPLSLRLAGELDPDALRRALDRILARHEALRTTFVLIDGEPVQRIASVEDSRFLLLTHDLRTHATPEEELQRLARLEAGTAGQQDIVPGTPVANRGRTEIENLIGFFVNTLALRIDLSRTRHRRLRHPRIRDSPGRDRIDHRHHLGRDPQARRGSDGTTTSLSSGGTPC